MQKLYLFKSDHEREKIGDVIIDLNAIRCIKCVDAKDMLCILVEFDDDHGFKQWFKDKNNFDNELHNILIGMGMSEQAALELKRDIVIADRNKDLEKAKRLTEMLDTLKETLA